MPPKSSNASKRSKSTASSRVSTLKLEPISAVPPAKKQKLKPMMTLSKPPLFDLTGSQSSQFSPPQNSRDLRGKGKAIARSFVENAAAISADTKPATHPGDQMWVDMYEPVSEETLAVHVRKVQDIRQWLSEAFEGGSSGKLKSYRRILVLTGPAGTAKTTTLKVLSRELEFEISEWKNGVDDKPSQDAGDTLDVYEGLNDKFQAFVTRAASCRPILVSAPSAGPGQLSPQTHEKKQIILLEDLPNILQTQTQQRFHAALQTVANNTFPPIAPIVIIVSDAGLRGESSQEDTGSSSGWKGRGKDTIDIRTVLPPPLLVSPYVTQIRFNPIAPTLMRKALQNLVTTHFNSNSSQSSASPPSKDILDIIVDSSNGDIRSAIMALQFACISGHSVAKAKGRAKGRRTGTGLESRALIEAVTRREQTLALFHLVGKLLYNKRKGDTPPPSASKKDIERDRLLDTRLKDPDKLPKHLSLHDRKASRVDIEALYADSPIDSSLLSLYVHQNYTQYCNELEECGDVVDWLSWVDATGGEHWYSANPHRFHLVSLATLHSLPCPVPRRNQKPYKPEFFEMLKTEREAGDGVADVHDWLRRDEYGCAGGWTCKDITLELGAVLKARDTIDHHRALPSAPSSHRLFSRMAFTKGRTGLTELVDETDDPQRDAELMAESQDTTGIGGHIPESEADLGGWLEEDDIQES